MCGRYTLAADVETLQQAFQLDLVEAQLQPRYNIAPTQPVPVVIDEGGRRRLTLFRWGLIPAWAKDPAIGSQMINARAETLAEKASFKRPLRRQRCLVLADGFYEWRKDPDGRTPFYVSLVDRAPFALAGLWDAWRSPEGEMVSSCTIITTSPNELMARLHPRMPVILAASAIAPWLDPRQTEPELLLPLLRPYPAEEMRFHQVSRRVNSPSHDSPECIEPTA